MRNILNSEIKKERCNAAALGAYNASVDAGIVDKGEKEKVFNDFNMSQMDFIRNPPKDVFRWEDGKKGEAVLVRYSLIFNPYSGKIDYSKNGRKGNKGFTQGLAFKKLVSGELQMGKKK